MEKSRILLLAWILASVACGTEPPDAPPLSADVGFEGLTLVLLNRDARSWRDATLTIQPGSYSTRVDDVPAGGRVSVRSDLFANPQGQRFNPYQIKPVTFEMTATVNGHPMTWTTPFRYDRP